jgi:hypothetical protein
LQIIANNTVIKAGYTYVMKVILVLVTLTQKIKMFSFYKKVLGWTRIVWSRDQFLNHELDPRDELWPSRVKFHSLSKDEHSTLRSPPPQRCTHSLLAKSEGPNS